MTTAVPADVGGRLAGLAALLPRGEATVDEVADAFLTAHVYATRTGDDATPGVMLSGTATFPSVCVFSDLTLLATAVFARPGTPTTYLTTTGADLLGLLPQGCGVVLDPLGPTAVLLSYPLLLRRAEAATT